MSCDPDELFSFEEFEAMWKKYAKCGLLLSGFIFKILLVNSEDAGNTQEDTHSIEDFHKLFDKVSNLEKLNERIIDLFNFMIENNFI